MTDATTHAMTHESVVKVRGAGGLPQQIEIGRHRLRADEPVVAGGDDSGPTPYQLLLAALGSCISMTVSLYAERKGWPLEGVEVRLRHDKIHAADCAECETREGKLDRIVKEVRLEGALDDEQRSRLLEMAAVAARGGENCSLRQRSNGQKPDILRGTWRNRNLTI
jgi:putative redox protein